MRAGSTTLVALSLALLVSSCTAPAEDGGCASPGINSITPQKAGVGDELSISGGYFLSQCGDTVANDVASKSEKFDGTLTIMLTQRRHDYTLAKTKVDDSGTFSIKVQVPAGVLTGAAEVHTDFTNARGMSFTII